MINDVDLTVGLQVLLKVHIALVAIGYEGVLLRAFRGRPGEDKPVDTPFERTGVLPRCQLVDQGHLLI